MADSTVVITKSLAKIESRFGQILYPLDTGQNK